MISSRTIILFHVILSIHMIEYSCGYRKDKINNFHQRFTSETFEWANSSNDFMRKRRLWSIRQLPTVAFLSALNTGDRSTNYCKEIILKGVLNKFGVPVRTDICKNSRSSRLHFSFNMNNYNENDDENDIQKNLPDWAKSLFKVSLTTGDSMKKLSKDFSDEDALKSSNNNKSRLSSEDRNLGSDLTSSLFMPMSNINNSPLASLINVEALLAASGLDNIDEKSDSNFFSTPLSEKVRRERSASTITDQVDTRAKNENQEIPSPDGFSTMQEMGDWNNLAQSLQNNLIDLLETTPKGPSLELSAATELILKSATSQIEDFLGYATTTIKPDKVKSLILKAGNSFLLDENADNFQIAMEYIVSSAESLARERGLNVTSAAEQARASTRDTIQLVSTVNGLLSYGYVGEIDVHDFDEDSAYDPQTKIDPRFIPKPLFHNFPSVRSIESSEFDKAIKMGVEMASLSGAIYLNTLPTVHSLDHSLVSNGTSADVKWMVTDSIADKKDFDDMVEDELNKSSKFLVRTITIRGFDASDENVDREKLLNVICTADPVDLGGVTKEVKLHKGLLQAAKEIYNDIRSYIDYTGPNHKIVFNGHSIGGSIAVLILLIILEERGVNYIMEKILRVFTFGSPPVAKVEKKENSNIDSKIKNDCDVLALLGLPASKVYGYVQPWDPIVRLFSTIDPLYPLVGDLGEDGVTLYASGPDRALRPITRAIFESWENWPTLRDNFSDTGSQNYRSIGVQHLLLPESSRYLTDRFVSVNIGTTPVETVVRLSSNELLLALPETFPLDTFTISYVPTALRSFIHHFYPAYGKPFADFFEKYMKKETTVEEMYDANSQINHEKLLSNE